MQAAREASRRTSCNNKIRQATLAAILYQNARKTFPPASNINAASDSRTCSFVAIILPYFEEQSLQNLVNFNLLWTDASNKIARETPLPFLRCPTQDAADMTYTSLPGASPTVYEPSTLAVHYTAVMGAKRQECPQLANEVYTVDCALSTTAGHVATNGIMYYDTKTKLCRTRPKDITDGLSKTFLLGEQSWEAGFHRVWIVGREGGIVYSGNNMMYTINTGARTPPPGSAAIAVTANDTSFGSKHPGGVHFGKADGSAKFVSENTAIEILRAGASRAAGETLTSDF